MKQKSILIFALCLALSGSFTTSLAEETITVSEGEAFSPAMLGIPWSESYEFGYLGLHLKLSEELKPLMDSEELLMTTMENPTPEMDAIEYACVVWSYMTEEQRKQQVSDLDGYDEWMNSLQRVGVIGVYRTDTVDRLNEITGCDEHTELGKSDDGTYSYYLSTSSEAQKPQTEAVKECAVTLTDMAPYQEYASAFDVPRADVNNVGTFQTTDINGTAVDQSIFAGHELTLVNLFTTWCSPCVEELPELQTFYEKLGPELDIGVVGVVMDTTDENFQQTDDTAEALEKAKLLAEKTGCTFPLLIPDKTGMNGRLTGISAFPETFFVDSDGNIVGGTYSGSSDLEGWTETVKAELEALRTEASTEIES